MLVGFETGWREYLAVPHRRMVVMGISNHRKNVEATMILGGLAIWSEWAFSFGV